MVRAHGSDPISFSTLQPGLSYFDTSFGYIAYVRALGFELTLGPPVCAPGDRESLIRQFLRHSRRPLFFYVDADVAAQVQGLGGRRFHRAGMGTDKFLSLQPAATHSAKVCGALKKAARAGLEVEALPHAPAPPERTRLEEITRRYLQRSSVPVEMRFLNRPLSLGDGSRTYLLKQRGRTFGYAVLDPYYAGGAVRGYLVNLIRFEPTRLWGVYYSAVASLMSSLAAEGVAELSLGFSPLTGVQTEGASRWLGPQLVWLERRLGGIDYLRRLRELKEAFEGACVQRHFVSPSPFALPVLLALLKACGVPLREILRRTFSGAPSVTEAERAPAPAPVPAP